MKDRRVEIRNYTEASRVSNGLDVCVSRSESAPKMFFAAVFKRERRCKGFFGLDICLRIAVDAWLPDLCVCSSSDYVGAHPGTFTVCACFSPLVIPGIDCARARF